MNSREQLFDPISMFNSIIEQLKSGEITLEQANLVGEQMPEGYKFEFVSDDTDEE